MVLGGLMQLVAFGAMDIYLTESSEITFFKYTKPNHQNQIDNLIKKKHELTLEEFKSVITELLQRQKESGLSQLCQVCSNESNKNVFVLWCGHITCLDCANIFVKMDIDKCHICHHKIYTRESTT